MPEQICRSERTSCHGIGETKFMSIMPDNSLSPFVGEGWGEGDGPQLTRLVPENKMAVGLETAVSRRVQSQARPA